MSTDSQEPDETLAGVKNDIATHCDDWAECIHPKNLLAIDKILRAAQVEAIAESFAADDFMHSKYDITNTEYEFRKVPRV